jgi:hypothetical protein
MKIWLTLDSAWSYLVDGVGGCGFWTSEPVLNPETGWSTDGQPVDALRGGRALLLHPACDMIDRAIMLHFVPDMDMSLDRWERFDLVRQRVKNTEAIARSTWKMPLEVTPKEWFELASRSSEIELADARYAQREFDLPF